MKNVHWILLASLAAVPTLAVAGPAPGTPAASTLSQHVEMGVLEQSVRLELDVVGGLVEGIDAILTDSERGQLSAEAVEAHREAKRLYAEGKQLVTEGQYPAGYRKIRGAKRAVMPAVEEVYSKGIPMDVHQAVAKQLDASAKRVEAIADAVAHHATPEARAAYDKARGHWQTGESQYRGDQIRPAFKELEACLADLDVAIKEIWKTAGD